MLRQIITAGLLTLAAVGSAAAQSGPPAAPAQTAQRPLTMVQACEAQRLAMINTLGADYDARQVHDACVARLTTGGTRSR